MFRIIKSYRQFISCLYLLLYFCCLINDNVSFAQTTAVSNMGRNIMILGKENELHIIQESSPCTSLKVYSDNGQIKSMGKCKYIYIPEKVGMSQIVVKGPKGEYNYLVRVEEEASLIEVFLGYIPQGPIFRNDITNQLGIIIKVNGAASTHPYKVLSYSMMINRESKVVRNFTFKGPRFSEEAKEELRKTQINDQVIFYNIVVEDKTGQSKYIQPAQFMVR